MPRRLCISVYIITVIIVYLQIVKCFIVSKLYAGQKVTYTAFKRHNVGKRGNNLDLVNEVEKLYQTVLRSFILVHW